MRIAWKVAEWIVTEEGGVYRLGRVKNDPNFDENSASAHIETIDEIDHLDLELLEEGSKNNVVCNILCRLIHRAFGIEQVGG